ncbi:MAG: hypothetical protein J5525_13370 [Lachnospiraceae bacterium]|nr:hypothetical protein [Lachnospiraceae bacterium]
MKLIFSDIDTDNITQVQKIIESEHSNSVVYYERFSVLFIGAAGLTILSVIGACVSYFVADLLIPYFLVAMMGFGAASVFSEDHNICTSKEKKRKELAKNYGDILKDTSDILSYIKESNKVRDYLETYKNPTIDIFEDKIKICISSKTIKDDSVRIHKKEKIFELKWPKSIIRTVVEIKDDKSITVNFKKLEDFLRKDLGDIKNQQILLKTYIKKNNLLQSMTCEPESLIEENSGLKEYIIED